MVTTSWSQDEGRDRRKEKGQIVSQIAPFMGPEQVEEPKIRSNDAVGVPELPHWRIAVAPSRSHALPGFQIKNGFISSHAAPHIRAP